MRVLVTGGTGFIGHAVVRTLLARGFDVTALARHPERARELEDLGATLTQGDVTVPATLRFAGYDAVFHLAAWYALGVRDRAAMEAVNIGGTENVLRAARDADVPRVLYVSTIAVLGRAQPGGVADENMPHTGTFGSLYEETKFRAHEIAKRYAAGGLPLVTVMPGATYGAGDHSMVGVLLRLYAKRILLACPFQDTGLSWVHVDDVAEGIARAFEKGENGERYILGGDNETIAGMFRRIAPHTGLRAPATMPNALLRLATPAGPLISRAIGQEPDLIKEGLRSLRGSWMFSSSKAETDLDYRYRSIEDGVPRVIQALRDA